MIQAMPYSEPVVITPQLKLADALNQILRGEMSAVEAYKQVMEKIDSKPEKVRLQEFLESHERNVEYWRRQVSSVTAKPDTSSGPWGLVVQAFMGTAKLFGETSTLKALKTGEEHGISEYRALLANDFVALQDKRFVRDKVIPELEMHLASIEAMTKVQ